MKKKLYFKKKIKPAQKKAQEKSKAPGKKNINLSAILDKTTYSLRVFSLLNLVLVCAILGLFLLHLLDVYASAVQQRSEYILQYQYWYQITEKYTNYPDAYYNLALYATRLNLQGKAKEFISKTLELDPEFEQAKALKEEIDRLTITIEAKK